MPAVPLSITSAGPVPEILAALGRVPDPRRGQGRRHGLTTVLVLALMGVLAGATSVAGINDWAVHVGPRALKALRMKAAVPSLATFHRVLRAVDHEVFARLMYAHVALRFTDHGRWRLIAVDGKALRGARVALASAFDHAGFTIAQHVISAGDEITAVRDLLAGIDLTGTVVTFDALHTQHATARQVIDAGGHYVMCCKGNQKTLLRACKALPWPAVPGHPDLDHSHGRRVRRTIWVIDAPEDFAFEGIARIAKVLRTRTINGKQTRETIYILTSLDATDASPSELAAMIRGHWGIENKSHYVRDVTYREDHHQARRGAAPINLATLRCLAINLHRAAGATNIAHATRTHAYNWHHPPKLLLTSTNTPRTT